VREEEFDTLRSWGDGLTRDPRPEVAAAGKAILLLASEVERLQIELWHSRLGVTPQPGVEPLVDETATAKLDTELHGQARSRARRLLSAAPRLRHARSATTEIE
jgi:hypothetical protein